MAEKNSMASAAGRYLARFQGRSDATEAELLRWDDQEHRERVAIMGWFKRLTMVGWQLGFVLAVSLPVVWTAAPWVAPKTLAGLATLYLALAIPHVWTSYAKRIFEVRHLIGPIQWLRGYPSDVFNVGR